MFMQLVPLIGSLKGRLRALLLPGLFGLLAGAAGAQGAGTTGGTGGAQGATWPGPITQHPLVVPASPFQWSSASGLGPVKVPVPGHFGWTHLIGQDWQARVVPNARGYKTTPAAIAIGDDGKRIVGQLALRLGRRLRR